VPEEEKLQDRIREDEGVVRLNILDTSNDQKSGLVNDDSNNLSTLRYMESDISPSHYIRHKFIIAHETSQKRLFKQHSQIVIPL